MLTRFEARRRNLGVFSIIWIIVMSGGVFLNSESVGPYALIGSAIIVLVQFAFSWRLMFSIYANRFGLFLLIGFVALLTVIANSDYASLLTYVNFILILALALGTSVLVSNALLAEVFVKTVLVLALFSIFFFYTGLIEEHANLFPVIEFHDHQYVNAFVYLVFDGLERRNLSIFVEPGLFQIYLNFSLFIVLYVGREFRFKYLVISILLLSLYSTSSTTGLMLGLLIVSGKLVVADYKRRAGLSFVAAVGLAGAMMLFVSSDFFLTNIEEKFQSSKQKSFMTRQNSTIIDLLIIEKNPIFGGGVGEYQGAMDVYSSSGLEIDAATNTFTQIGAIFGLPLVALILFRSARYFLSLPLAFFARLVALIAYLVCFSTQPFVLYPIFYVPFFMSIVRLRYSHSNN